MVAAPEREQRERNRERLLVRLGVHSAERKSKTLDPTAVTVFALCLWD